MTLARNIIKSIIVFVIVTLLVIFIVLFPRDAQMVLVDGVMEQQYEMSWESYIHNIQQFFKGIVENKSLGGTNRHHSVEDIIVTFIPRSLEIIVAAFIISIFAGIWKGIFDYRNANKKMNFLGNGLTFLIQAIPDFFLIILIQLLVIKFLPFIPLFSIGEWYSFLVPTFIVAIFPTMYIARITSTAIANEQGLQYIAVARAKGFTEKIVLYKHILRNCYVTILSHCSSVTIYIISNLLMVEYLMAYPGAAYRLFQAMDFSNVLSAGRRSAYEGELIIGLAMCFMLIVLISQIISEIAANRLDPRRKEQL